MAIIKPFKGLRPAPEIVTEVSSRPYDVMNSTEARTLAKDKEKSLLHIIRPEIDFPVGTDEHDTEVYQKAAENFALFQEKGWLVQDTTPCYYIYAQTMNGRTQYGLVACASIDDYGNGIIKKHELTRTEKEEDRTKHVRSTQANMEPVFLSYPAVEEIDKIIRDVVKNDIPVYDFVARGTGFGHHFWVVKDEEIINQITTLFVDKVPATYIADGHHRTAAAAKAGFEKRAENPNYTGDEEYNYLLAVHFPANQLEIIDYNRVVTDLNGLTPEALLQQLDKNFVIEAKGENPYKPEHLHNFGLFVDKTWYSLTAKKGVYNDNDPIGVLDVTISSNLIFRDILGIEDLRTSKRIDFVGGIRGLEELQQRVLRGEMELALALFPVSMQQIINIADTNNIMPPKTTWFEPKLRSGLIVHKL